jgi:hypothetical protein
VAASGGIVDAPMAAVALVNSTALPSAAVSYQLMSQILKDNAFPLIFVALPISASAIGEGLLAYEATLANSRLAYERVGIEPPKG